MSREIRYSAQSKIILRTCDSLPEVARITGEFLSRGAVALSGGTTYAALFPHWASSGVDCTRSRFFPVDERKVPFDSPESNWGAAWRGLLKPVGKLDDKEHFARSGAHYQEMLRREFPAFPPVFDIVFLGAGSDGHTASLFPGTPEVDDMESVVVETRSPVPPVERITLGMRVLVAARELVIVVWGESKRNVVKAVVEGDTRLPVVKVLTLRRESLVLVDNNLV